MSVRKPDGGLTDEDLLALSNSTLKASPRPLTQVTVSADDLYSITHELMSRRAADFSHRVQIAKLADVLPVDKEAERLVDVMMAKAIENAPKHKLTIASLTSEERETLTSLREALSRCTWIEGAEWSVIKASIAVLDRLLEIK